MLSDFFASVYTVRSNDTLPEQGNEHIIHEMEVPEINSTIVEKLLLDLKTSKSPGPDRIHPRVLQELASQLAYPLSKIFKSSIATGQVPES